jgi:hypothetical protein
MKIIDRMVIARDVLEDLDDFLGEIDRAIAAFEEAIEERVFVMMLIAPFLQISDLLWRIALEVVDRHDDGQTELLDVLQMGLKVIHAFRKGIDILGLARFSNASPPCIFRARIVATMTARSGWSPPSREAISRNFSAPKSAAKPASVTTIGANLRAILVAIKLLQPWAILAKGPPWIKTGLFSKVWTKFGLSASFISFMTAWVHLEVFDRHRFAFFVIGDDDLAGAGRGNPPRPWPST